jgi:3-dehydroquinate dehydratase-1
MQSKIAIPITDENFDEVLVKAKKANILEFRVDYFSNKDISFVSGLLKKAKENGFETILTIRSEKEGGAYVENRVEMFEKLMPLSDYTDIELSSTDIITYISKLSKEYNKKLIVSYHNFEMTPANFVIKETIREALRYGDIPKIALKANSYEDVARLMCSASDIKTPKILISMGEFGKISRIAGFIFGSFISYVYLEKPNAPGQLSLEEMLKLKEMFYLR